MHPLENLKQSIITQLTGFLPNTDIKPSDLVRPPDTAMGDLSIPCFSFAKSLGKAPTLVAVELAQHWKPGDGIKDVKAVGPYLNFFFDREAFSKMITLSVLENSEHFGETAAQHDRVMIEYASPNTLKEFHIGHLRNVFLGLSIVRLLRAVGNQIIPVSYINDNGAHIAKTLWAYKKFHANDPIPKNKGKFFGGIYSEATRILEEDPDVKKEIADVQHALEAHDPEWTKLWEKTRLWSLEEYEVLFAELGLDFARMYYSSEVDELGRVIVQNLLDTGIAKKSQGAVIVDLESENLGVCLLLKTDGSSLYATQDLALPQKKFSEYEVDRSLHVVDIRQSLYFKQLFSIFKKMGIAKPMVHVAYDFVTLKEGSMSSRKGNIITYEDFRDEMISRVSNETQKRHEDWSQEKIRQTAWMIAEGAMKFGMLKQDIDRPIVFDMEAALSFDGFTGPYIQYAHVRLSSILERAAAGKTAQKKDNETQMQKEGSDYAALRLAADFPDIVAKAAAAYSPAILAQYLFDFAQACNEFYRDTPVLSETGALREQRLATTKALQVVLKRGLYLLGIQAPEEM